MQRDIKRNFGRRTFLKSAGAIAGCAALGQATHVFAATKDSRGIPFFHTWKLAANFIAEYGSTAAALRHR